MQKKQALAAMLLSITPALASCGGAGGEISSVSSLPPVVATQTSQTTQTTQPTQTAQNTRTRVGVGVLMFLALLTVFTWRLNASFWKEIK